VRSRSTAVIPKVSLVTETLRSKDDSDKENICLLPEESIQKGKLEDRCSTVESLSKDSLLHSSDHPLSERTQVIHFENPHYCVQTCLCVLD
jgi:hypothetical protein